MVSSDDDDFEMPEVSTSNYLPQNTTNTKALEDKVKRLEAELAQAKSLCGTQEEKVTQLDIEVDRLRSELSLPTAATEKATATLQEKEEEITGLRADAQKQKDSISGLRTELDGCRNREANQETTISGLHKDIEGYRNREANQETTITELRTELDGCRNRETELNAQEHNHHARRTAQEKAVEAHRAAVESHEASVKENEYGIKLILWLAKKFHGELELTPRQCTLPKPPPDQEPGDGKQPLPPWYRYISTRLLEADALQTELKPTRDRALELGAYLNDHPTLVLGVLNASDKKIESLKMLLREMYVGSFRTSVVTSSTLGSDGRENAM